MLAGEGSEGLCSKRKLSTTHNHHRRRRHYRILLQLLLKVLIVARVIFKRRNPGAAEDGAKDELVNIAMKDSATHACPLACP